jgi:hypothetical protein
MEILIYKSSQLQNYLKENSDNLKHIVEGLNISSIQDVTQDYWVSGLRLSFGILKNPEKHSVSETGSISFLRSELGDPYSVVSIRKN